MVEKLICHTCSLLCVTNNHLTSQSSEDRVFFYSQFAKTFFVFNQLCHLNLLHNFSLFSLYPFFICFSFPFPLRLCMCTPSACGCSQGQYRPAVWSYSKSTSMRWPAQHQPASHQLKRWSDCSFSAYCVWWMTPYLHTLNFSTAVISFVRLDKHQLWTGKFNQETWDVRW